MEKAWSILYAFRAPAIGGENPHLAPAVLEVGIGGVRLRSETASGKKKQHGPHSPRSSHEPTSPKGGGGHIVWESPLHELHAWHRLPGKGGWGGLFCFMHLGGRGEVPLGGG